MKPQERALLLAIARQHATAGAVRRMCETLGVWKQNAYYLQKWADKGWYDYGVCVDLGWLTEDGYAAAMMAAALEVLSPN